MGEMKCYNSNMSLALNEFDKYVGTEIGGGTYRDEFGEKGAISTGVNNASLFVLWEIRGTDRPRLPAYGASKV